MVILSEPEGPRRISIAGCFIVEKHGNGWEAQVSQSFVAETSRESIVMIMTMNFPRPFRAEY
jgi:hypothetical protein